MAGGVLENLLTTLLEDCSKSFIANIWNVNDNFNTLRDTLHEKLKELQETLTRIHAQGYSLRCTQVPSDWLDQLVWCHYEIEDTTDSINLAVSNQTLTTKILQTHLKRIRRLLNELQAMETKLSLKIHPEQQQSTSPTCGGSGRVSVSPALEFLRVKDKEAIIRELKSHTIGVSILGIGGTGKTKLAEAIVEDASIKDHFPCILSPPLSPKFSLKSALEFVNGAIRGENTRVLIKLDGVQSVSPEDWLHFQSQCLQKLHMPCKLLITTQNPKVADATGCAKYVLGSLSAAECFSLICHRAQGNKNLYEDDVLAINYNEAELVEKCKGLPLLANHIGLLLSAEAPGSRDKIVRAITTNSIWKQSGLERVLHELCPVSMLARKQHLQRCVTYCSLLPPEHEFIRDDLVQLWMMEGFIQATSTTEDACFLEQAASDCFDDLLSHSIFKASDDDDDDEEKSTYKMHQLLYDLAQNLGSKTHCWIHDPDFSLSPYVRHLSLSCEKAIPRLLNDIRTCNGLRTFLLLNRAGEKITKTPTFFETLERLRVLDLRRTKLTKLARMSKLKHLRYLDLSHTPIKALSPLSKNHPALLVLKLNGCDLLLCLPNDLSELTNLVSLQVNMKSLSVMPRNIGRLSKLQTLNVFIVGKEEGCKITELKNMNQIRGSLCITKLENVETVSDAQEAMLQKKNRLERLELQWTTSKTSNESAKKVLEGLVPHKNLKELTIRRYSGFEFPQWLSTPQVCGMLKTIHLANCATCTTLPSLGQHPMLRTLYLESMNKLTRLSNEFFSGGFLCLESLKLCELPDLTEWTELTVGCMPRLRELQIVNCQRLVKLPPFDHLCSLESLEFHECPLLEELPTLPSSMKTLIITESGILGQRCQVEHLDWNKIRGINVLIDSERLDTGVQSLLSAPDHEEVGGQQPSICLRVINQESDIIQEGSWQHQIPKSQGQSEIQTAKRIRLTSNTTITSKTSN
ncbi:hypothetical protein V2J09_010440 [Rumex salicifolius]